MMAGFLRPFLQIAPLGTRSHERSQCSIRATAPLWSSDVHVGSKRAMYLQLSMRSVRPCDPRRRSQARRARAAGSVCRLALGSSRRTRRDVVRRRPTSMLAWSRAAFALTLRIARSNAGAAHARARGAPPWSVGGRSSPAGGRAAANGCARGCSARRFGACDAAPRRAIRPSGGVARSPGRRPSGAGGTRGAQGTSDPLGETRRD
jgi:hypothetical protein